MDSENDLEKSNEISPFNLTQDQLANNIINEIDPDKSKKLIDLFNMNQSKKNTLRILKLNNLLDKVVDQMSERFDHQANIINNADLFNYLQVTQNAIDKSSKSLKELDSMPTIQFNQLNVNTRGELTNDERQNILDYVNAVLKNKDTTIIKEEQDPVIIESSDINNIDDQVIDNNILLNDEET